MKMENPVLDEIKKFAIEKLLATYGYCGYSERPEFAMINSDDRNGKDITITIKSGDESK